MSAEETPVAQVEGDAAPVEQAVGAAIADAAAEAGPDATLEQVTVTEVTAPTGETVVATEVTTTEPVQAEVTEGTVNAANGANEATPEIKPAALEGKSDPLSLPPHGTEVFVGGIPRSATEDDIRNFASKIGEVHSVKMTYDPSTPGQHRGFGFVRYLTRDLAAEAKLKLNETKLEGTESLLRVSNSQSKYRLYVANLPRAWNKDQVTDELHKNTKGLETVELVPSREYPGQNRGYAFLTFYNHECAAAAKIALERPPYKMEGRSLTVSYAEPKPLEQDQNNSLKSRAVYVGGLPPGATDEKIKELFVKHGEVLKVVIPPATEKRPEQRFGFVHFASQASADAATSAAEAGDKPVLDDKTLEVKAARPQENRMESRQQFDNYGAWQGGRGGRGPSQFGRGGRMGRGVRGPPMGRGPPQGGYYPPAYDQGYGGYEQGYGGYDQGYGGGYDQAYGAYDQGYAGYDQYGGYEAQPAGQQGMTMVPMMLQNGQVGYVLQNEGQQAGAEYGGYGGPDRAYGHGRGRGRGPQRYMPY